VLLDGEPVVIDRAHGVSDRGVGRLRTILGATAGNGRWFELERVLVLGSHPLQQAVYADGFE
jgi:hypothetical protein